MNQVIKSSCMEYTPITLLSEVERSGVHDVIKLAERRTSRPVCNVMGQVFQHNLLLSARDLKFKKIVHYVTNSKKANCSLTNSFSNPLPYWNLLCYFFRSGLTLFRSTP